MYTPGLPYNFKYFPLTYLSSHNLAIFLSSDKVNLSCLIGIHFSINFIFYLIVIICDIRWSSTSEFNSTNVVALRKFIGILLISFSTRKCYPFVYIFLLILPFSFSTPFIYALACNYTSTSPYMTIIITGWSN